MDVREAEAKQCSQNIAKREVWFISHFSVPLSLRSIVLNARVQLGGKWDTNAGHTMCDVNPQSGEHALRNRFGHFKLQGTSKRGGATVNSMN